MADRYWVGGSGNWDASTTTNWASSSGGAGGQSVPTSSDNVFFDLHSNEPGDTNYTVTITSLAYCLNLDISFTGTTKVTIAGTGTIYIYGDCNFSGGSAQVLWTNTGYLRMEGAGKTLTTNGVVMPNTVRANNSTAMKLGSDITFTLRNGFSISQTTAGKFDANGYKVTLNVGNVMTGTNQWFEENLTLYDLTITGNTGVYNNIQFGSYTLTVTNNLVINGNSALNRLLIKSTVPGTQRTITAANVTVTNCDFRDIKGAGAGSWDLSAIAGGSGDCDGNTDITFTTADDWYWHADAGNFSDYTKWYTETNGGGTKMASTRVPLPQDTCYFDANSFDNTGQTITINMARIGAFNFTNAANSPTLAGSTDCQLQGSVTLISAMTVSNISWAMIGRRTMIIDTGGCTSFTGQIDVVTYSGKVQLNNNLVGLSMLSLYAGELDANDYDITMQRFYTIHNANYGTTRTLKMGNGTWTLNRASFALWNVDSTSGLTFDAEGSTIKVTSVLTGDITLVFGALTYNNFWNNSTGAYILTVGNASTTFNDFKIDAGRSMKFTNYTTTTVTTFTALGTSGSHITIANSSGTTHATLAKAGGGTISGCDYIDIQEITGSPATTWYIGANSTDTGSTCTEIYLLDGPATSNTSNFFNFI